MRLYHSIPKNQRGDTIVEVLIAVAVISSVLVGAFIVSQRSTVAVRGGQEHSEALQILQGQVELTRTMALAQTNSTTGVFAVPPVEAKYFCINGANPSSPAIVRLPNLGSNAMPDLNADNFTTNYGTGACANIQTRYNIAASYNTTTDVFTFTARWEGPNGNRNQESLIYRIQSGLAEPVTATAVLGAADVGITGCATDANGNCVGGPPPAIYYWGSYFTNRTAASGLAPIGCKWEFVDGFSYTNRFCDSGDVLPVHTWAIPPGTRPYNQDCNRYGRSVTLTMYYPGVSSQKTYTDNIPHCYR